MASLSTQVIFKPNEGQHLDLLGHNSIRCGLAGVLAYSSDAMSR